MSLQEPKPKKQKTVEDAVAEEDENGEQAPMPLRNDEGEAYFEISNKRRVTVREFKGKVLVDIREVCVEGGVVSL